MSNKPIEKNDPISSPEFAAAVEQYLSLVDDGVTKDTLVAFLGQYREQSDAFQQALLECIVLATAQPPECIEYAKSLLESDDPGGSGRSAPSAVEFRRTHRRASHG